MDPQLISAGGSSFLLREYCSARQLAEHSALNN
jgi:hypothetical protein